ncbi:MAG TPA: hypothetical protein VK589_12790, partial [Chryseolinea sp.]|nr:hypothetical protein [Chryseolinea sp.]
MVIISRGCHPERLLPSLDTCAYRMGLANCIATNELSREGSAGWQTAIIKKCRSCFGQILRGEVH